MCRDAILPMPLMCEVPCPKDCTLSPWTSWSHCSHTCSGKNTEGKQMRARSILAYNAGEGKSPDSSRPCSSHREASVGPPDYGGHVAHECHACAPLQ